MKADTWRRIEELFAAASLQPAGNRERFLQEFCPDDSEIRSEVLSLLKSADEPESFLDHAPEPRNLASGAKISHFEINELMAAGEWVKFIALGMFT